MKEGGKSASDFGDTDSLVKSDRQAICQRKSVGDEKSALLTIDPQDRKVLPKEEELWNARGPTGSCRESKSYAQPRTGWRKPGVRTTDGQRAAPIVVPVMRRGCLNPGAR